MSMIHLILKRLATDPGLFAEHASAYAELAALEAGQARLAWQHRAMAVAASLALALLALALTGLALMLAAALPWQAMPAPWALWCVPALFWVACATSWWFASSRPRPPAFPHLRQQWAVDAQHLRDAALL